MEITASGALGADCSPSVLSAATLPDPVYLKWWADGGTCTYALADKTLPPGRYSVESCHAKRFLWFFHKWHCWQGGPIFEVKERGQ